MKIEIDVADFAEKIKSGKGLSGKDGALTDLVRQITEMTLQAELESHLAQDLQKNRKNGYMSKTMRTEHGEFELETPRDRNGSFEPQIVKKSQTYLSDEIEKKMLSLFSLGSSYSQISEHIEDIYGVHFSKPAITTVTDKLIPMLEEWKIRPLDAIYPFIYLDAIHYKVREDGHYVSKAFYTVLGINLEGKKEILGLYLNESEGAKFWLQVLTDLQNRGVQDILIASVDGLKGFPEAINAVFPETEVQLCIVHQIRNSVKYIASKDQKIFVGELKSVYQAFTKEEAELALDKLESKWGKKYPIVFESWRNKWDNLSNYFKYPEPIRRIIYTTNIIESIHRQFRTLTKTKGAFPNDNSLLKLLFAGIRNAEKKWTMPIHNWSLTISQLNIFFKERLKDALGLGL
ncbi:IS256 family transposase [Candidatus Sulfurimonas baltica]|jgi:putative transposase|uniref:Mutator family transposase n=1 Tax=Candidatus Sulfurimonas baltica TaxID=2740404 RepID=A0A7S7RM63_9BACT|nr:IS256 family transposase [Candidatus Sulfurimonas baltica]QOY51000.1 IS256 family transposase [Candidatus Sulfurimonas baltica]QOY52708.1 IS256 family transposase [Candidatus Sulfurimonas baltica]